MSEFTLKAPGVTICEIIEADGLIEAEEAARAWGTENGHARVEIFDAESPGSSALTEVVIRAGEYRVRYPGDAAPVTVRVEDA